MDLSLFEYDPKATLAQLTNDMIATYRQEDSIHHLGYCPLPNYRVIVETLEDLKDVLFPGYRRKEKLHFGNVEYQIGQLIDSVNERLTNQISRALCHDRGLSISCTAQQRQDFERIGLEKSIEFLRRLPEVRHKLMLDVQAAYKGDPACKSYDEAVFCYPGIEAITVYRIAHELYTLGVPLIPRMMSEWAHSKTGIDIHPGATIGESFFIDHGTGVVIGQTCNIGNWVKLYQGVTLGALSFPTDEEGNLVRGVKRHPTIEDNVVIYANATILGGQTVIGKDCVIGSSVWLTQSVAPGTTVTIERPKLRIKE